MVRWVAYKLNKQNKRSRNVSVQGTWTRASSRETQKDHPPKARRASNGSKTPPNRFTIHRRTSEWSFQRPAQDVFRKQGHRMQLSWIEGQIKTWGILHPKPQVDNSTSVDPTWPEVHSWKCCSRRILWGGSTQSVPPVGRLSPACSTLISSRYAGVPT